MPSEHREHPPLLRAGLHEVNLAELRALCVESSRLQGSARRDQIMASLERAVQVLNANNIPGELWIDGSFLTEKPDPEDVDTSLRLSGEFYDQATPRQRQILKWFTEIAAAENIDGYLHLEWPAGHPHHAIGVENCEYWKKQWGTSRAGVAKGIAVLKLARSLP
jgi:hypothetical protein